MKKRVSASRTEQIQILMPEHINGAGRLFGGKLVEKAALKKIHGTVIEELLERYHLI